MLKVYYDIDWLNEMTGSSKLHGLCVEVRLSIYKNKREGDTRSSINPSIRLGISLRARLIGLPEG